MLNIKPHKYILLLYIYAERREKKHLKIIDLNKINMGAKK